MGMWFKGSEAESITVGKVLMTRSEGCRTGPVLLNMAVTLDLTKSSRTHSLGVVQEGAAALEHTSIIRFILDRSMQIPPCNAAMWPSRDVPVPKGMMGVRVLAHAWTTCEHQLGKVYTLRRI